MTAFFRFLLGVVAVAFGAAVINLAMTGLPEMDRAAATVRIPAAEPATAAVPSPALPAAASVDAAAVRSVWAGWMARNGIETGAMALALADGTVLGDGLNRAFDDVAPVASLSKAITGLCLDGLLREQGLGWDATLGELGPRMSAAGLTPRPWNANITLEALATHRAGLAPDLTQGELAADLHGALGLHRRIASEALQEAALQGSPGTYFYANTNYAVLGVVIEALSGDSYARTCMDRVVRPAAIDDAVIEGRMGSMSAYAGWEVSAADYARIARHWFSADRPWVSAPENGPLARGYAMGYAIEGRGREAIVTHTGRLCSDNEARDNIGAAFVASGEGTAFAANWNGCIDMRIYGQLIDEITPLLR